ncbi:Metallo-hydrolase/oxidoreductase [Acrodontium crateriforme]|uniref:Metallo-hydrolase/oxidoreductase n=1 Tax=Acrodontium crateriforme TaxID=150365 RepID=A0AAQ3M851_9PEZI|nr:Metallo-hydrolase/oxidoreductase [Acrodontium crateriforme]
MPQSKPLPDLHIPHSRSTVSVSIIDSTGHVSNIPVKAFMEPPVPGYDLLSAPCYSFLIKRNNPENPSKYDTLLFDLGIRKDVDNSPKVILERINNGGFKVSVSKNISEILQDNGEDLNSVGGIIWSHHHWDHTGDPSTFAPSTDLIVGPTFKSKFVPGYPTKEDSLVDERAWEGRDLREIDFDSESNGLKLGRFRAYDFFGDGSFYLLESPGHTMNHMCGLARTSAEPAEFIIMGGDICHHGGEWRPNAYVPLPENIQPNPLVAPFAETASVCPGSIFEAIHPNKSSDEPFMKPAGAVHEDQQQVIESAQKWEEFDAAANVFAVIAHDQSLFDILEYYPKRANNWREKGWKDQGRWRFLRDFDTGNDEHKPQ